MDLRHGINMAVDTIISHLKHRAWMISTPEEITQVKIFLRKEFLLLYRHVYLL